MNRQGRPILTTNLRTKIILGILAILLTCMVTIGSIFLARERKRLEEDIRSRGQALATIIAHFSATPIEKYSFYIIQEVARNVEQAPGVGFCEIYDANGDSLVHLDRQDTSRNDSAPKQNILLISQNIIRDNRLLGTVELGLELAPVEREITTYLMGLIVAGITILLLVAILISLFLSYYFISPVVQLSTVAKNIAKGNFVTSNSAGRKDEIGELAAAFNSMSLNLQQLYSTLERKVEERTADLELTNHKLQQEIRARKRTEKELHAAIDAAEQANRYKSNFVAMISHEIRTPLNAILGYTQILQSRGGGGRSPAQGA